MAVRVVALVHSEEERTVIRAHLSDTEEKEALIVGDATPEAMVAMKEEGILFARDIRSETADPSLPLVRHVVTLSEIGLFLDEIQSQRDVELVRFLSKMKALVESRIGCSLPGVKRVEPYSLLKALDLSKGNQFVLKLRDESAIPFFLDALQSAKVDVLQANGRYLLVGLRAESDVGSLLRDDLVWDIRPYRQPSTSS